MDALNNVSLMGMELSLGWSKSIPLPAVPIYPPAAVAAAYGQPPGASPAEYGGPADYGYRDRRGRPYESGSRQQVVGVGPPIEVHIPSDPRLQYIIDTVAMYVLKDGCAFEQVRCPRTRMHCHSCISGQGAHLRKAIMKVARDIATKNIISLPKNFNVIRQASHIFCCAIPGCLHF